jgi:hypothetical protein
MIYWSRLPSSYTHGQRLLNYRLYLSRRTFADADQVLSFSE